MSDDSRDATMIPGPGNTVGLMQMTGDENHVTTVRKRYLKQALDTLDALGYSDRDFLDVHFLTQKDGSGPYSLVIEPQRDDADALVIAPKKVVSES